jgi:predicted membrane-bound spermidine synthase
VLRTLGISITVFGCGWILMGLEIVGGRMLAPFFGSGIEVWGSVISVFLASLSVGYYLGGLLTRRFPHVLGLASVILAASASILPVAIWHAAINERIADIGWHERWGSLLSASALFLVPSILLGMVSPYAVQLLTRSVRDVGASAGTLYALSTSGSFLGCLLTAFYFIVWMGIRRILLLSAASLLGIALVLVITWYAGSFNTKDERT